MSTAASTSPYPGTTTIPAYADPPVHVRVRLALLWVAMLLVFAYVDLFGFFRADVLEAALDGQIAGTGLEVGQGFLAGALGYVLPAVLMVVASLYLRPRAARLTTLAVAPLYAVSIVALCIGETWVYYLLGSGVEVVLLLMVTVTAWRWHPCHDEVTASR